MPNHNLMIQCPAPFLRPSEARNVPYRIPLGTSIPLQVYPSSNDLLWDFSEFSERPPPMLRADLPSFPSDSKDSHSSSAKNTNPGQLWVPPTQPIIQHPSPRFPRILQLMTLCLQALSSLSKLSESWSGNFSQLPELACFLWFMFLWSFFGLEALSRPSLCRQTWGHGSFWLHFSHLLVVEFSTHFYSLFYLPWLCSYR